MSFPLLSVRAELVRAAMHFISKGDEARSHPERAGVRFEPSATGGVSVIAMCESAALMLRDPRGRCLRPVTLRLPASLFESARREQRETKQSAADALLQVDFGVASISGVSMQAQEIDTPFPPWRRLPLPHTRGAPPPIASSDAIRVANAAVILEALADVEAPGVCFSGAAGPEDAALATFDAWPDAFAVLSPAGGATKRSPASFLWMLSGECVSEQRVAS